MHIEPDIACGVREQEVVAHAGQAERVHQRLEHAPAQPVAARRRVKYEQHHFRRIVMPGARGLGAQPFVDAENAQMGIGGAIEKRIIGDTCAWICDAMPENRPRHVLGIASVDDIFACVENGGDTFDCVAPARCARNGAIYTRAGRYNIKRAQHKFDFGPLEEGCDCYTCQHYSRAYVDHLLRAREFNGFTLATIHNEHFFVKLLDDIRASIDGGYFDEFRDEALAHFYGNGERRPGL